jgi:peptidoglycan/LPS O-acetylase OafA/YrhL
VNSRSRAFPLVDSLRTIAVLSVIAIHAGIYAGALAPGALTRPYLYRLESAAWAFFLISGLVLYRPWVAARLRGDDSPSARAFAWRRVLRIVPAYWLALVLTGLIVRGNDVFTAHHGPAYFLFGQIYSSHTASSGIPQAWTLDVEVAFYAFLPLWAWFMRRLPGRTPARRLRSELLALGALALASVAYKAIVLWSGAAGARTTALDPLLTALPGFLDVFAIGMAMAAIHAYRAEAPQPPRGLGWLDRRPGLAWVGAAAVLWLAAIPLRLSDQPAAGWTHAEFALRHLTNTAIAVLALAPLVFGDQTRGLLRRALAHRTLLWLGMVSYGAYLYHLIVIGKLGDWRLGDHLNVVHPYLRWYGLAVAGAVLFAAASWYGLERPLQRYRGLVRGNRPDPTSREMAVAAHQPAPAAEQVI